MKYEIKVFDKNEKLTNVMIFKTEAECEEWFYQFTVRRNIQDSTYQITDVTERERLKEVIEENKRIGQSRKQCCEDVLNFVTGYNISNDLSIDQINVMQEQYGNALIALNSNRVDIAKALIEAGEPDEVITTQELKDGCLQIFEQHGI